MFDSGWRPIVIMVSVSEKRSPVGSTIDPAPAPPTPSTIRPTIWKAPVWSRSSATSSTSTGPMKRVALVPGVLAGGVGQLAAEAVLDALELLEVARRTARR